MKRTFFSLNVALLLPLALAIGPALARAQPTLPAASSPNPALAAKLAEVLNQLPAPAHHPGNLPEATAALRAQQGRNYEKLLQEKIQDQWFAALVVTAGAEPWAIQHRFDSWKNLVEFLYKQNALVEVWAYPESGQTKPRRILAPEMAALKKQKAEQPTFITVTYKDTASGQVFTQRVEFSFRAAKDVLAANQGYQRSRDLQLAAREVLSARDAAGKLTALAQWDALQRAVNEGRITIAEMPQQPANANDLFLAIEYEVDEFNNYSRIARAWRESEIQKRIVKETQFLLLKRAGEKEGREALGFRMRGVSDELEAVPRPILGQDIVELRVKDLRQPDPRKWHVLEFGEPEMLKQSALAKFSLLSAHLEKRRKEISIKKAKLGLIAEPMIAAMQIGGGLSGVNYPVGDAGRLLYNLIAMQLIPDVPNVKQMRGLFALMAARDRDPALKTKPEHYLSGDDIKQLKEAGQKMSDQEVQEYLERINDDDLQAMLRLAQMGKIDAQITAFMNLLTSVFKLTGESEKPGILRDLFNNVRFAMNGDINLKTLLFIAIGDRVMTPLGGTSLEQLSKGQGPTRAWFQFFDVSIDVRAIINTVVRWTKPTLAKKELEKPLPYAPRMTDLAAYEIRIFGFPLLMYYKYGLSKADLAAYQNDYAYGLLGVKLVEHFETREKMDAEIRAGRMLPLGYVRVSNGKGGWKETNLAVFAHKIPSGRYAGKTSIIIYGLKAYEEHSEYVERELKRFQQFEQSLQEGAVIEQVVETEAGSVIAPKDFEPTLQLGPSANDEHYAPVLGGLLELRRAALRKLWGLPTDPDESQQLAAVRAALAAKNIRVDEQDPQLDVDKFNSTFRYRRIVDGKWRVVKVINIPSLADMQRELEKAQIGERIEQQRKEAISGKTGGVIQLNRVQPDQAHSVKVASLSSLADIRRDFAQVQIGKRIEPQRQEGGPGKSGGVILLNEVKLVNGRNEIGPLLRDLKNEVVGAGVTSGPAAMEKIFDLINQLPVTDRARLRYNNFAATIVNLDLDGDGATEQVFLTIEFALGPVQREWTNPLSGEREILFFDQGLWRRAVTDRRIVELEYDEGKRETRSRTWFNRGTYQEAQPGELLEETRTLETWLRDLSQSNLDPSLPLIAKLNVNYITGQIARETYGLFPLPVETADEQFITRNRFNPHGLFASAKVHENGVTDADFQRTPMAKVLNPTPGRGRFDLTATTPGLANLWNLSTVGYLTTVERKDLLKGLTKTETFDNGRSGRKTGESYVDAFDGTRSFAVASAAEYRDDFFYGFIPIKTSRRSATGEVLSEVTTSSYDSVGRSLAGVEVDYTGKASTNTWDARWENPVQVETSLRTTINQYSRDATSVTGATTAKPTGEQVGSFTGQFDTASNTWRIARTLWYRPGIPSRTETNTFTGFGKLISTRIADVLESRVSYDAAGREISRQTFLRNAANSQFDILQRQDDDYRWQNGERDARVQIFVDGLPYDEYRATIDSEGRTTIDAIKQPLPSLSLKTVITYDGASERTLRAEAQQNNEVRVSHLPQSEVRQTDGSYILPVRVVPSWGLVFTNHYRLPDPLARPITTVFENGESANVTAWFDGTSSARISEVSDRSGRLTARFVKRLNAGTEAGLPYDLLTRYKVDHWGATGVAEAKTVIRATDIALFKDTPEERWFFDLTKLYDAPLFALDRHGLSGFNLMLNGSPQSHVTSVFKTSFRERTVINQPSERVLDLESVDLHGLFYHKFARQTFDRAGKIVEERAGKIRNRGQGAYTPDALFNALNQATSLKDVVYRYEPGWLAEQTETGTGEETLAFVNQQPAAPAKSWRVNEAAWRDWPTQLEVRQAAAEEKFATTRYHSHRVNRPRELKRNPHLPDVADVWTAWTRVELSPEGKTLYESETIYNGQGQPSTTVTRKKTSEGGRADKIVYRLAGPRSEVWQTNTLALGANAISLNLNGRKDFSRSDFLYCHLESTNALPLSMEIKDMAGRIAIVTAENTNDSKHVVPFWPVASGATKWLPDEVVPEHGAVVAAPAYVMRNRGVLAVSVSELKSAGLDVQQLALVSLIANAKAGGVLKVSPIFALVGLRGLPRDEKLHGFAYTERVHSSGLETFTRTKSQRSPAEIRADLKWNSVAKFGGLQVATVSPQTRGAIFPVLTMLDNSDPDSPRPLYALVADTGDFLEFYKTLHWGDAQVYTVASGFLTPKFEVYRAGVLDDELSPGVLAYGHDYSVTIPLAKSSGGLSKTIANLHNRMVASAFKYGGDRFLRLFLPREAGPSEITHLRQDFQEAGAQAREINQLPLLAEAVLPLRDVPWKQAAPVDFPALEVSTNVLKVRLNSLSTTYKKPLISTALETAAAPFVDTVKEAGLIELAVKLNETSVAAALLDFYWNASQGGEDPLLSSYDARSGAPLAPVPRFQRPTGAIATAEAQLAIAQAAFTLGVATSDGKALALGVNLTSNLLTNFRPPPAPRGEPRGLIEYPHIPARHRYGVTLWPEAEHYTLRSNARAYLLFKRLEQIMDLFPFESEWKLLIKNARREQEAWLTNYILPHVERTGVVPKGVFQIQDIKGETTAYAAERWTSADDWLTFIEAADAMGRPKEVTRRWLENLARVHGVTVQGKWGLDWSVALRRADAISPDLTARFMRVAKLVGHQEAAEFAQHNLNAMSQAGKWPTVITEPIGDPALQTGQGFAIFPSTNTPVLATGQTAPRQEWGETLGVHWERLDWSWTTGLTAVTPMTGRLDEQRDITKFLWLAAGFYLLMLAISVLWWILSALRRRKHAHADPSTRTGPMVPGTVMQKAEERWAKRVLGVLTPPNADRTRFSNGAVEQNFHMQLRAIYKLVLEWRRMENGWAEDDSRLVDDGNDDFLNGLDEFATMVGIYSRFVVKAGKKDGGRKEDVLEENEDSNHVWSRLVMFFSESHWGLLELMKQYKAEPGAAEVFGVNGQIEQVLRLMGMRRRWEFFDARQAFNVPADKNALDLLVVQLPGATLAKVADELESKLSIPREHFVSFVKNFKSFKEREQVYPIHPYSIEAAKLLPHFLLMGLVALIWYNLDIGGQPILPYLGEQFLGMAHKFESLIWAVPLFSGFALSALAHYLSIYRYRERIRSQGESEMLLDMTVTSFFTKAQSASPAIRASRWWNPLWYQRAGWALRAVGFVALGVELLGWETPSFGTFMFVKGLLALFLFVEALAIVVPLVATSLSQWLEDRVSSQPKVHPFTKFLNSLNFSATKPASLLWLSLNYHFQPSVPSGGFRAMTQAVLFYLFFAAVFFFIGGYVCKEVLRVWFSDTYQNASDFKLLLGSFVFWNTMYLLRFGLFVLFVSIGTGFANFPVKMLGGCLALGYLGLVAKDNSYASLFNAFPFVSYPLLAVGLAVMAFEQRFIEWLKSLPPFRRRSELKEADKRQQLEAFKADPNKALGIVYMSGDELSYQKIPSDVLMNRWQILRDKLGSDGCEVLALLHQRPDDTTLAQWFKELYDLEKKHDVTLWHSMQLVVPGETPRLPSELGLNFGVDSPEQRRQLLDAWHIRRWLVTMMSTAGHSQDTAINLVDFALRLERQGLASSTAFYLIQNKYDNNDNNRPSQLAYDKGELGHRNKLARLIMEVAPGSRAYSVNDWTPFGFKAGGMVGMDLVHEETLKLTNMVVLDRNANVHDLDALMEDITDAIADPGIVIIIPGRSTTNTRTPLGQGSQLVEEGHRAQIKGLMLIGGNAGEHVGTGWGNIQAVYYGRVQRALVDPDTPKMPLTSRLQRGAPFGDRFEGLIGFGPHAVGISEDIWGVSQTAHNALALGNEVKFKQSKAFWHKVRETWSHAEWFSAFPRWSGGYLQMMLDPIMQRINDAGPLSVFAKELRANSGRFFLSAPFALLNILIMPLAIMWDLSPFVQILVVLWNFGFIMNQVLTALGLMACLEGTGFYKIPACIGALTAGVASAIVPALRPFAAGFIALGFLGGGFAIGFGRWLYDRGRDVLLFGPQLVIQAMGQIVRQSLEFVLSGASVNDAKGVNIAFRAWVGPREDRPFDSYANFINLRSVVWGVGVLSLALNLFALQGLDFLNVVLLLPSLLFSVSTIVGPFLMKPEAGNSIGPRIWIPKLLGWLTGFAFYAVVARLMAQPGWQKTLGVFILAACFGRVIFAALRYVPYPGRLKRLTVRLVNLLVAGGLAAKDADKLAQNIIRNLGGDVAKITAALNRPPLTSEHQAAMLKLVQDEVLPLLRQPITDMTKSRFANCRFAGAYQRSFVLSLFTFLWFFIVPIPGLLIFTAFDYRLSMSLQTLLVIVFGAIGLALAGLCVARFLEWLILRGSAGRSLLERIANNYRQFQSLLQTPGLLSSTDVSSLYALFTDAQTYVDQRSYAYARRTLGLIEQTLRNTVPAVRPM